MAVTKVEAFVGRERNGSPMPKSRAQRGTSTATVLREKKINDGRN
jgi:hypothetical protein